jgi:hypothetical protein
MAGLDALSLAASPFLVGGWTRRDLSLLLRSVGFGTSSPLGVDSRVCVGVSLLREVVHVPLSSSSMK